jgi:hypothetical protein
MKNELDLARALASKAESDLRMAESVGRSALRAFTVMSLIGHTKRPQGKLFRFL